MTILTPQTGNALNISGQAPNEITLAPQIKPGAGYPYDSYLTYDELNDPVSGNPVKYDSIGSETTWTPQNKS